MEPPSSSSADIVLSLPDPVSAVSSSSKSSKTAVTADSSCAAVVDPSKLFPVEQDSVLMKHLDNAKEAVIGLEYQLEIREDYHRSNPSVVCLLCAKECMASAFMAHVYSPTHRLRYLESFFPIARSKFAKVPNLSVWEKSSFEHLDSVVTRIEARLGRLKPWVVQGRHFFNMEVESIRKVVEAGNHFKEAVGLNFRTIPDPFESYIKKLSRKEIVEVPKDRNDPKPKPGIDLRVPWTPTSDPRQGESSLMDVEKNSVMHKIANLRKEIKDDDKVMGNTKKYREDLKKKAGNNSKKNDKDDVVEVVSDDEASGSKDLKLRKPEKRGIRSRNPDGLNSRRDKDKESKIPPERELYMDREVKNKEKDNSRDSRSDSRNERDSRSDRDRDSRSERDRMTRKDRRSEDL